MVTFLPSRCLTTIRGFAYIRIYNYTRFFFLKPHFICNLYIYIQEIGVRIRCYGLGRGTH
jgi:hypothetical protein